MGDQSKYVKALMWFNELETGHNSWGGPRPVRFHALGPVVMRALLKAIEAEDFVVKHGVCPIAVAHKLTMEPSKLLGLTGEEAEFFNTMAAQLIKETEKEMK